MNALIKEDYAALGPAMRALNERQRNFVRAYVTHPPGYGALVNSYAAAGYGSTDRATMSKCAHTLSRDERVIAAIREEATRRDWSFIIHRTDRPASELLLALHARIGVATAGAGAHWPVVAAEPRAST